MTDHSAAVATTVAATGAVAGTLLHEVSVVLQILVYIASLASATLGALYYYRKLKDK